MAEASALLLLASEGKASAELHAAFSAGELRNKTYFTGGRAEEQAGKANEVAGARQGATAKDEGRQAAAERKGLALHLWIFKGLLDEVS